MDATTSLLQNLVLVPLTLLPIINPLSGAPVFMSTTGNDPVLIRRLARQIAFNSWVVLVVSMLMGTYVLDFFGISLPIVRISGGLLVAATGWKMLHSDGEDDVKRAVANSQAQRLSEKDVISQSFFPITFPLTTGPGTIAASIALGAKLPSQPAVYVIGFLTAAFGAAITSYVIYLVYRHSVQLLDRLGTIGAMVMARLMAFILLCIGIEIIWAGWLELNARTK